jgi:hypothetical protein
MTATNLYYIGENYRNNEFESMRKEAVMVFEYSAGICIEELTKKIKTLRTASVIIKYKYIIVKNHFYNTKLNLLQLKVIHVKNLKQTCCSKLPHQYKYMTS